MRQPSRFWLTLLYLILALTVASSSHSKQYIAEFLTFEDSSNLLTPSEIQEIPIENWTPIKSGTLNLGYRASTIWLKFDISNPLPEPKLRLLDLNYPLLDFVRLFELSESKKPIELMSSGDGLPFDTRNISHPSFINELLFEPNQKRSFLISIKSNAPIQTELLLWDIDSFQKHYRSISSANFFYLGIILSACAFNLFVYLFLRETIYLIYGIYAGFFALLMTSQNAILFEYVIPNAPAAHNWSQLILACGSVSFTALFNLYFLKLRRDQIGYTLLLLFSIIPAVLLSISPIIGFPMAIKVAVASALIIIPACFIIGVYYANQSSDRTLYLLAWFWLICGVLIFLAAKIGLLSFNTYTNNAIQLGSALELLTFAVALARRIHREKETRIQAQEILIEGSRHSAELQKELLYQATHNSITGLPNKAYFENWLNQEIKNKPNGLLAVVQLSRISEIEKTLGTGLAEEALEKFSVRLNTLIQTITGIQMIDLSEGFAIATLDSSTHGFYIHPAHTEQFIAEIEAATEELNLPLNISNMEIEPYVRIAYVEKNNENQSASQLIRQGGIALEHTGSSYFITHYREEKDQYTQKRLLLMRELKEAISSNELTLDYQPLTDTLTGKYIGGEALIRWPHKEHGLIMPDQFIDVAERTGVIQSLSLWVFKHAITTLKSWLKINANFLLSINISATNIQDKKFIEAVQFLLHDHQELSKNMILEITESQMMTDTKTALKNLWTLSELGFHIAIDDFGTGYSNLAYLKKLPASELKIDKSFILNLESDKQNQILVHTAIEMAHNLGLKVVAEGVESEKCRILLGEMGCDMCQGFHISRPVNKEQFETLLKANG